MINAVSWIPFLKKAKLARKQQVREMTNRYAEQAARLQAVIVELQANARQVSDKDHRELVQPLVEEVVTDLTQNNLNRLVSFIQLKDDSSLTADEKVALVISGWILGAEGANQKISLAISLLQVRDKVRRYLREPLAHERQTLLESIRSAEGADVVNLARLIAHMPPPWTIPQEGVRQFGAYELTAPGQSGLRTFSKSLTKQRMKLCTSILRNN